MCGIAGIFDAKAQRSEVALLAIARAMADPLAHRGPDDAGLWADAAHGVGLGFRRLAILDLSLAGHQPMASASSRYVVVFNGEIYNHRELRRELDHESFRGHSDTEVMLAAFSRWGVRGATERFNGMFAFAVWDHVRQSLILGRDRLGEKPLYYGMIGQAFTFGSELKALRRAPGFNAQIDRGAVSLFFRHGYIPAPYTIYEGISKLPPGTLLEVNARNVGAPVPYWSALEAATNGLRQPFPGGEDDAQSCLHDRLRRAVALRLEADVPLGAFLSGGIDSSLVVALMQAETLQPVRTFTIGFTEPQYDEAPYARAVAEHLGTTHTEMYVTPLEACATIPRLTTVYDEPFADSSQLPTLILSELARRSVTVSLSGDGGDELFGGYNRYLLLDKLWSRLSRVPLPARTLAALAIRRLSTRRWDRLFQRIEPAIPRRMRRSHPGDNLYKLARVLRKSSADAVYLELLSLWEDPAAVVIGGTEPMTAITRGGDGLQAETASLRAMHMDSVTYLPDDLMVKVDRAAMAVSLETRMPLVDHTLYEFAWSLPPSLRIRAGVGKQLLRRVLHSYLPETLVERPKMGFGVPIASWLRGPLREWAGDLLSTDLVRRHGLLRPDALQEAWAEHLAGDVDLSYQLWPALMLQAWLAEYMP